VGLRIADSKPRSGERKPVWKTGIHLHVSVKTEGAVSICYVPSLGFSCDDDRNTKGYLKRSEKLQAGVRDLNANVVAIRPVTAEHINLVLLL